MKEIVWTTKPSMTDVFDNLGLCERILVSVVFLTCTSTLDGNTVLNKIALVCASWHTHVAPHLRDCLPALARCVPLDNRCMCNVAVNAQPWWVCVKGKRCVTDAGLARLAAVCRNIATLELCFCIQITDAGLGSLAAGCRNITLLDLCCCEAITDAGLRSLAAGCTAITNLRLAGCIHITDAGLQSLAAGCTAITDLDLTGCIQITKTGLESLAAGCPAIITLNLTGCDEVNEWEPEDVFGDRLGPGLTWRI